MRALALILISLVISGCDVTSRPGATFATPAGTVANTAKCTQAPDACYRKASELCGGPYQVINSERHWGGILTESGQGTMWYAMTYQCGPSDGKLAAFQMRDTPTLNANISVRNQ